MVLIFVLYAPVIKHEAFRPDKKACCKQCPPAIVEDSQLAKDQQNPNGTIGHRTPEDILADGGCNYAPTDDVFENGHEWHPRVHSHGEVKCVKCRCKDGIIKCERKRCLRSSCTPGSVSYASSKRRLNSALTTGSDECCSQCRRNRRHHRPSYNNS
ncbi:Dorsal-ventral patterning protein Sog [Blattella germanica]|nr:Dorsal-ventral patterning protein Sog [Blattella germanica]